ncbi:MAG: hypothetical protein JEZ01_04370 [Labilibaculum sp.]|nr:hypothetical protein [Labilibaculum sp.]MBI9056987.1 hypothetical protein [Labilibaculum sp.]
MNIKNIAIGSILLIGLLGACESESEKRIRIAKQEQIRIEKEQKLAKEKRDREIHLAEAARQKAIKKEQERKEKAIYDKYINNSLWTGATPYSNCFGGNGSCSGRGCSQIKVKTPFNSDVLVTIKKNKQVFRHAYIKANSSFTFDFPDGTYQTFFYYGKGWNPNKVMKRNSNGIVKGGFIANEVFGKDRSQLIENGILTYELILQKNGNFTTQSSSKEEAF